ncbi:hypothetical protein DS909_05630 [Phaeobacter gallaeciensis]|uniref:Uncharacterized protein n=1 Tax=Phaeobacter gallaeciensis TaxID=60890 RepID=A0A366X727_9RHOB|nr:hypothetical protein DS909_05630 [Phaeobacter gallaeciensis]
MIRLREGGFQSFAAVVSLPSEKDGSGHSERVKIEDFSAVPHGGSEPILPVFCTAANDGFQEDASEDALPHKPAFLFHLLSH